MKNDCEKFVLKPQREGGGYNLFGKELKFEKNLVFLVKMSIFIFNQLNFYKETLLNIYKMKKTSTHIY